LTRTFSKSRHDLSASLLILAAGCALAFSASVCRAQKPAEPLVPQPLEARTDIVRVDVGVLNKRGDFAEGLERSNFRILDDGAERPIVFFAPVEAPARVLVMMETSPAVYLIHDEHLAAAYALLQGLDPADQVALVTYSQGPREILGFTTDKSALLDALNTLQYTIGSGDLNFYDSLSAVLDGLAPAEGKTAIVLLSTGLDSSPSSRWEPLVEKLRGTDVVIFPVALGGTLRGDENSKTKSKKRAPHPPREAAQTPESPGHLNAFARADRALISLGQITGGRVYFPQSDNDFAPIYRQIAAALRHQYVLGIAPAHDGKFHALSVEVLAGRGQAANEPPKKSPYRIFAREGYTAPNP
jgi:Ca-activated chloride channel homolog